MKRVKNANEIIINGQNLYFGISIPPTEELSYTLPPKPPPGAFDARFDDDKYTMNNRGIIEIMNPSDLLSISYNIINMDEEWIMKIPESHIEYLSLIHI